MRGLPLRGTFPFFSILPLSRTETNLSHASPLYLFPLGIPLSAGPRLRPKSPPLHARQPSDKDSTRAFHHRRGDTDDNKDSAFGRERFATKLLLGEGYPAAPVTAVACAGYRQVPFTHAPPSRPKATDANASGVVGGRGRTIPNYGGLGDLKSSSTTRRRAVDAPTSQSWSSSSRSDGGGGGDHPRRKAEVVVSLIDASRELSRDVMERTERANAYFSTVEASSHTASELARRLRKSPTERVCGRAVSSTASTGSTAQGVDAAAAVAAAAAALGTGAGKIEEGAEEEEAARDEKKEEEEQSGGEDQGEDEEATFTDIVGKDEHGGEEPQFGVLQVKEATFPATIATGGPVNHLLSLPSRYCSPLQPQCVPRPWRSYGAGYRKPAPLETFTPNQSDDPNLLEHLRRNGEEAFYSMSGTFFPAGSGGPSVRRPLVPRVVDATGEARR